MARTKKNKKEDKKEKKDSILAQEIWGSVFTALGLWVLIALVSYIVNPNDNLLGEWFGQWPAVGLTVLFGKIVAFSFPIGCIVVGLKTMRGRQLSIRTMVVWPLLTFELSVLLAINSLATIRSATTLSPNIIGNIVVYGLTTPFPKHTFGPYLLFSLMLMGTIVVGLRINVHILFISIYNFIKSVFVKIGSIFSKIFSSVNRWNAEQKAEAQIKLADKNSVQEQPEQIKKSRLKSKNIEASNTEIVDDKSSTNSVVESQAKDALERQLAEFRAKKNEPIKIISNESEDIDELPAEDNVEEVEEFDLIPPADGDDDYFKVPAENDTSDKPSIPKKVYVVPSPDVLEDPPVTSKDIDRDAIELNSHTLEKTLMNFGIEGKVNHVSPGPVVTRYEIELAPGIKISRVVSLQDDLAMALGGKKIRLQAPIPGKAAIGVELPNSEFEMVHFKHILISDTFKKSKAKLPVVIGKGVSGRPLVADITKMPHMLIAGQTGAGKSVCINSLIGSLLMTKTPEELRLILVDPKKVELSYYEGIPHLMSPVVTESKEAVKALQWSVNEMTRRYKVLARAHARNIEGFNKKVEDGTIEDGVLTEEDNKLMPYIVIIVDELADLMLMAKNDVEFLIQRIAQLARAVGMHIIVATQRPSTDIITGRIKANLTSRISFRTIQGVDSRTIVDKVGAEKLLGRGDMLFLRNGAPDLERYHGSFISEEDVERIVKAIKAQEIEIDKIESFEKVVAEEENGAGNLSGRKTDDFDEYFEEAARLIVSAGQGSTSLIQRRLKLGYARAGRVMDQLHSVGIVGPQEGSKAREVRIRPEELEGVLAEINGYVS